MARILLKDPTLDFDLDFAALTGRAPYRWQRRLFDEYVAAGDAPSAIDVSTGLGKTMVIALWLIARARGVDLPRRLVYVVDRRAVVDQATEEAEKLAKALANVDDPRIAALRAGLGLDDAGLPISTLRGQHLDDREWLRRPHMPAIIVGTVDMIGSRLLFEGYGVSRRARPFHAGLLGVDAWVVLDEAHLVPAFEALLRDVAANDPVDPIPRFRVTTLSATARTTGGRVFSLDSDDVDRDEAARKRLGAAKRLIVRKSPDKDLAAAMARCAVDLAKNGGRRVIVFANSRKVAQAVAAAIAKMAPKAPRPALLVGARRVRERELLTENDVFKRFLSGAEITRGPAFLVATSAGEVGIDLDADAMVCDLAPWERMIQRLGRVNRRAEPGDSTVVVFDVTDDDGENAVESETESRKSASEFRQRMTASLRELFAGGKWPAGPDGAHDASPLALRRLTEASATDPDLRRLLDAATTPAPLRPALTPALLDAWSMTSLESHTGRALVGPWLRGWVAKEIQGRVLWRRILPGVDGLNPKESLARFDDFFEAAPPHMSEVLETYATEIAKFVQTRAVALREKDNALSGDEIVGVILKSDGSARGFFRLREISHENPLPRDFADRTLVLDARFGGLDANGLLAIEATRQPSTSDGDAIDWAPSAEIIGRRVRIVDSRSEIDRDWRIAFRQSDPEDFDATGGDELRVEVYRGRSPGVGDWAISRAAQTLTDHAADIVREIDAISRTLGLPPEFRDALRISAKLHDRGKARHMWQRAMRAPIDGVFYAKTEGGGNPRLLTVGDKTYRHEFGSLRDAEADEELNALSPDTRDLALHLIAAHHGFARPVIAAFDVDEPPSSSEARAGEVALRFARLQERWGWWALAWFESLLRAADGAASAKNDARESDRG